MKRNRMPQPLRAWAAVAAALAALPAAAQERTLAPNALPTGFQLVAGSGSAATRPGNVLDVTQASQRAVFGWNSFDIGAAATVNFRQPGANAVALNLIGGNDASLIYGKLNADAQVFFVNPHGMVFGRDAVVDVGGLLATTLAIGTDDFMNGNWRLANPGAGAIRNEGLLKAAGGIALVAKRVENAGEIFATAVTLAAGNSVAVDITGDGLIRARVVDAALSAHIANSGSIAATAAVALTAGQARDTLDRIVNNSGIVRATGLAERGGEIVLEGGTTTNSGTLDAGDGGRIKFWADGDAYAHGSFRARNGFIETSGKYLDTAGIAIDAAGGTWLIDPSDISIENHNVLGTPASTCGTAAGTQTCGSTAAQSVTHLDADIINAALNADTNVVIDTAVGSGGSGNITLYGSLAITKSAGSSATLTLNADGNITTNGGPPTGITATSGVLNVVLNANRSTVSASGGIGSIGPVSTNGGSFTATGSNIQLGSTVSTGGGAISLTANNASGSTGLSLSGTINSGGGHISLQSNSATAGMKLHGTLNAGTGYLTLNLPNGGTGTTYASGSKIVASGLQLLGANTNYHIGGGPQWIGWTGDSVNAPGAVVATTAQTGNPVLTVAGNLTGTSTVYLYVGTPDVAYVSGNGMNTDLSVGSVGGTNGLTATNVYLTAANGNIGQTQKITATDLYASSYGLVQGNKVDLALAAGNSVANLKASGAMCNAFSGCTVGPSATPSFQFTNATALNISGTIDAGNGAAVVKTLTGNLAITNVPALGVVRSKLAGSAASYANAIVLVAGANTPATFINSSGSTTFNLYGAYSRYLIYSKSTTGFSLGGAPPYSAANNGGYVPYFGPAYFASPYDGTGLPAAPANAAKPNVLVFQTQPTLNVTANAAARQYGDANPAFTYGASGFVLGATAAEILGGSLTSAATVTSGVGSYPITLGSLAAANGYLLNYAGANLTVGTRAVGIAADAATKVYGAADPALAYQVTSGSLANGDVFTLSRAAGEGVGNYAIGIGGNPNYSVSYTGANLAVTPAPLAVTANAKTKVFGSADPVFDYTVSGLVSNAGLGIADSEASVLSGALSRTAGESAAGGPYAIGQGSLTASANYSLAFTGSWLTITPAAAASGATAAADGDVAAAKASAAAAVQSTATAESVRGSDTAASGAATAAGAAARQEAGATTLRKDDDGSVRIDRPRGRMLVCRRS